MRIARAVAFAIAIAAPLAIFLWLEPPAADRGGSGGDSQRSATHETGRPAPSDSPPVPQVPRVPTPTREPAAREPSADGSWRIELDLRGPGGAPLATGRVHATPPGTKITRDDEREFTWRRDAATIDLTPVAWTIVAEAESDVAADAIPCGDLVSDPIPLDPKAPPPGALTVRLHARTGIFGRVLGPSAAPEPSSARPRIGVRWQRLDPGRSIDATELALRGHDATMVALGGGGAAYVVHDIEPGRYAVAVRGDPAGLLETPVEVDVVDAMVRHDLSLAAIDATTMLHAVVQGLASKELGLVSFFWIGHGREPGAGDRILARSDAPGSFWLAPVEPEARAQLQRVLEGTLSAGESASVALARDDAVVAAEPLTSGQHEVRFVCDAPASLRVRFATKIPDGAPRLDLALAPAAAARLLDAPPAMSLAMQASGVDGGEATDATAANPQSSARSEWTWTRLVPGDFVLVTWGQLHSALRHGEVWWPLARRDVVVKAGEQELEISSPPLHPFEVRFDRARFGKDAHVAVVLRRFPNWPLFAIPDESGIARFEELPDGDYTVTVVGDMIGESDFTMPGTSQLRVEPIRREEH